MIALVFIVLAWVVGIILGFAIANFRNWYIKEGTPSASHNSSSPKCGECGSDTITITCGKCHQVRQFGTWSSPHIGR